MTEVCNAVTRINLVGNTAPLKLCCFKLHDIEVFRHLGKGMKVHIDVGGGKIFYSGKSLTIFIASINLGHKRIGDNGGRKPLTPRDGVPNAR